MVYSSLKNGRHLAVAGLLGLGLVSLFSFQNCARVELSKESTASHPTLAFGSGELCLGTQNLNGSSEIRYDGYTVSHFYVANLNLIHNQGQLMIDTDSDGLSDDDEQVFGFDPQNRRSNSKVLDSICMDLSGNTNCSAVVPICSGTESVLGLNDCDSKALSLDKLGSQAVVGLDSDKDGVVDLLEILRRTDPAQADALNDPDRDGFLNIEEIQSGSDPLKFNPQLDPNTATKATLKLEKNTSTCSGESWKLDVTQIPYVQIAAFSDTTVKPNNQALDLSHGVDENSVVVIMRIQPKPGYSGNVKFLYQSLKISKLTKTFELKSSSFIEAGEVLP